MLRISLLLVVISSVTVCAQEPLYKDQLPTLVTKAHSEIEQVLSVLKSQLDDTTKFKYASYRWTFESRLKELQEFYKARNYQMFAKQANFWYESTARFDLMVDGEMPSTRKAKMQAILEYQGLDDFPVTKAFDDFMKAYTLFQNKVWMRKAHDSTQIVTALYLEKLSALEGALQASPRKEKYGNLQGELMGIRNWHQLSLFTADLKKLSDKAKSYKPYLEDEDFYTLSLQQKINAGWKPENIVTFGQAIFESIKAGSPKGFEKLFLSYNEAVEIYTPRYPGFNRVQYDKMQQQSLASFQEIINTLKQEGITPEKTESISDYTSEDYMNNISVPQRATYAPKYDVYVVFASSKGKYLLTVHEVPNSSFKKKVKHLSRLTIAHLD